MPIQTHRSRSAVPSLARAVVAGLFLGGALLAGSVQHAEAGEKLVTTFEPKVDGTLSPDERATLDKALVAALQESQFQLVAQSERDTIISGEGAQNCYSDECQERIGRLLGAQTVVYYRAKVTRPEGGAAPAPAPAAIKKSTKKGAAHEAPEPEPAGATTMTWNLSVSLFNVDVGAIGARANTDCNGCSAAQAAQNLADLVKRVVVEDAARARGTLEVISDPPNASVFVDGHELGPTPYKRVTFAGKHDVMVRKTGHRSEVKQVNILEAQRTTLNTKLQVGNDPVQYVMPIQKPRPKWRVVLGGVTTVVGVGVLAFGAYALSANGKCVSPAMSAGGECDQVYSTVGIGAPMTAIGALLTVGGVLMLAIPGPKVMPKGAEPAKDAAAWNISLGGVSSGFGAVLSGSY